MVVDQPSATSDVEVSVSREGGADDGASKGLAASQVVNVISFNKADKFN
jgi:hypothetical protein